MKKNIILLLLSFFCLSSIAEETTHVVVWAKDQSRVAYALDGNPKITFTETELVIESRGTKVNYPLESMDHLTYEAHPSSIKDLRSDKELIRLEGESLLFPSLKANSTMSIYSTDGILVLRKNILQEGEYAFPLSLLPTGVYLVNVNGLTYKIVRR